MNPARAPRSLRAVLLTAMSGVAVGAVVVTAVLTISLLNLTAERTAVAELRRDAEVIGRRLERAGNRLPALPPCRAMPSFGVAEVCFVPQGSTLPAVQGLDGSQGRAVVDGQEVYYATIPVQARRSGTVYVFRPVTSVGSPGRPVAGRVAVAGLVALAAAAAVAYALAGRIVRPLRELAGAAHRLARGEHVDLHPSAGDPEEVADLRDAFGGLSRDLTEARERERAFLMSVSHELRTPLTAIRGYGEALVDGTARGAQRAGGVIVSESRRLERLVQDLIDLARLQAGEFSVDVEEADLGRIARAVGESLRPRAGELGVRLEVRGEGGLVATDPDRAHQLLVNLAENAMRVSPDDGAVVVALDGRTAQVSDHGPGLTREDVEHAFDRFYLWRKYRGQRPVGSGLGLAIVGELAARLGVKVEVTSNAGEGTTFRLTFPPPV